MPPVPPPQPLPQPLSPDASGLDLLLSSNLFERSSPTDTRPVSLSFSSTMSAASFPSTEPAISPYFSAESSDTVSPIESRVASTDLRTRSLSMPHWSSSSAPREKTPQPRRSVVNSSTAESTSIGPVKELVPKMRINEMSERSLAMHLYRSFQSVMSIQESMWEELKDWVRNKSDALRQLGWESDGDLEELNVRRKFEKLLDTYRG